MFREYFAGETWVQTMPGIYSCLLNKEKSEKQYSKQLPVKLASGISEILFCIRGKITFRRNTGQMDQLGNQGILLISDCNQLKDAVIDEPLEGVCLCICRSAASNSLSRLCQAYGDIQISMTQVGQMMESWNGMCLIPTQAWSQSTFQSLLHLAPENRAQYCIMKCFELVYLLYRGDAETGVHPEIWKTDRLMKTAEAMQRFLLENLGEKLTINDLSRYFHLSATACKSCFRAYCGQPIHQWISNKRMEKAAELLSYSTMPIIEIAQSLGYSGCSQFNATFKKKYGKTPSQYRKSVHSR